MQADINKLEYENLLLLDLKLLLILDKSKSIVNISLTNVLICNNSNFDSNFINNSLLLEVDFVNRQELKELTILLRTRV